MNNYIIISGCSGGGKSTLLEALSSQGFNVVEEAGRRTVQSEHLKGGAALPLKNMPLFLKRAIALAIQDFAKVSTLTGPVFFDRSLVDLVIAYEHFTGSTKFTKILTTNQYASKVYFTPPWPEIYVNDAERQHSLEDAIKEYRRLESGYPKFGYEIQILPKASVQKRAKIIIDTL